MMHPATVPVITFDGPVGSGKGTVALRVARTLGWHYLDSGSIYRALALYAMQSGILLADGSALAALAHSMPLEFREGRAELDGKAVEEEIRTEEMGTHASQIAALPNVRKALLAWQREYAVLPGLVADGRDMGTVVFPHADCKIYLTASMKQRVKRRFNQLRVKGFAGTIDQVAEDIHERDQRDRERSLSPLRPADDACWLDTSTMSIEQSVEAALEWVARCRKQAANSDA